MSADEITHFIDKLLDDEINQVLNEKIKSIDLDKNKVLKGKFEVLLQNKDDQYLNKILSSDQGIITEKIKEKFFEKRSQRVSKISKIGNQDLERKIFLQIIDLNWKNHIQYLEQLRQVIGLRSYGQRDPLIEYKKESFQLFEKLLEKLRQDTLSILLNIRIENNSNLTTKRINPENKSKKKIGRNELCYCGSNKKFKHCCGSLSKI